jgi:hypothetical protein
MIFYRISYPYQDYIADVEYIDTVAAAVRSAEPGACPVDDISAEPLPSGHTSSRWGAVRITAGWNGASRPRSVAGVRKLIKRFPLASVMVMVAFGAMTAFFASEGIKLHRRGFTPKEIATVIGVPVAVGAIVLWAVLPFTRRRPAAGGPRRDGPTDEEAP